MDWDRYVDQPFRAAGVNPPKLTTLPSPYRFIVVPIVQFVLDLSTKHPDRKIVVRSEEHTSELQSHLNLVCRLLLQKKKTHNNHAGLNKRQKIHCVDLYQRHPAALLPSHIRSNRRCVPGLEAPPMT